MADSNQPIREFWDWFLAHQSELALLKSTDQPLWDRALDQLKLIDSHLWFELSAADGSVREFVITAEGNIDVFPVVEAIVNQAPSQDGWLFVALKRPMGFDFTTEYEGTLFEPRKMWFLPLESASRPRELGLRIGIPGLESIESGMAENAVLVILETGLGERSAAIDIQHVEVSELPAEPESSGFIELPELVDYIAWRKRRA